MEIANQIEHIEAVLFDAGRVLVNTDETATALRLSQLTRIPAERIHDAFAIKTLYGVYEGGVVHAAAFLKSIPQMLAGLDPSAPRITPEQAEAAFAEWIVGEVDGMSALVGQIRPEVRKLIVSNTNPIHWTRVLLRAPVVKCFQRRYTVLSCEVGIKKPDEAIFREALRCARVPASRALLIDDRTDNCEAFRRMGGRAIQFDCREQDARWLERELSPYGLF